MHWSVKFDLFIGFSFEFILGSKDFHYLFGQVLISIFSKIVLVNMFTNFKIKLDIFNIFELFFVLGHGTADKAMFVKFFFNTIFWKDQSIDGFMDFRVRIVVVKLFFYSLFGHFPCKLYWGHIRKPLLLCLFGP